MEKLLVQSSSHSYGIYIGKQLRYRIYDFLEKEYSSIFIVSDERVASLYLDDCLSNFPADKVYQSVVPSGEQSKSFEAYYQLQTDALTHGLDRNSLIIALGGGVVGDLAGFAAATYMRGIDYIQMPTTILAHDSSVGGKVAINHEIGKNLIGSFYPPKAVIYDVDTLSSLTDKEVRSGYAELVKEALINKQSFFEKLMDTDIYHVRPEQLTAHLLQGVKIKADIVEADERESGMRKYLNLGHTLAHALEAELGYGTLAHGEAVAIGLLFALHVSEQTYNVQLPYHALYEWLEKNRYPMDQSYVNRMDTLIAKMKTDKKAVNHKIQMVLLKGIGKPAIKTFSDSEIKHYLQSFKERLIV
ncbi:3-dehydroquinate synthase [Virgibacillus sp. YIM 98842]|uniref:3-dehydroquinate synthase n=1 Tax=Virgibacillus sp. YIM 98842 TaxID=2663533 RepID=UPI0013D92EB5|nr:3-dehydroquinate synthase [Virgibacillus sp. YIM 98842]